MNSRRGVKVVKIQLNQILAYYTSRAGQNSIQTPKGYHQIRQQQCLLQNHNYPYRHGRGLPSLTPTTPTTTTTIISLLHPHAFGFGLINRIDQIRFISTHSWTNLFPCSLSSYLFNTGKLFYGATYCPKGAAKHAQRGRSFFFYFMLSFKLQTPKGYDFV